MLPAIGSVANGVAVHRCGLCWKHQHPVKRYDRVFHHRQHASPAVTRLGRNGAEILFFSPWVNRLHGGLIAKAVAAPTWSQASQLTDAENQEAIHDYEEVYPSDVQVLSASSLIGTAVPITAFSDYDGAQRELQQVQQAKEQLSALLDDINSWQDDEVFPDGSETLLYDAIHKQDLEHRRNKRASSSQARRSQTTAQPQPVLAEPATVDGLVVSHKLRRRRVAANGVATSALAKGAVASFPERKERRGRLPKADSRTVEETDAPHRPAAPWVQRASETEPLQQAEGEQESTAPDSVTSTGWSWQRAQRRNARNYHVPHLRPMADVVDGPTSKKEAPAPAGSDATDAYLRAARNAELLTAEQEKKLSRVVRDYHNLRSIATELKGKLGREPTLQEHAAAARLDPSLLAARLQLGAQAVDVFLDANVRLVVSICKKYRHLGAYQDIVSVGTTGLRKALEKFDPDKGFKFSTYAHWWIKQAIMRHYTDQSRVIRVPVHVSELQSRAKKATQLLHEHLGRIPSKKELAAYLGVTVLKLVQMEKAFRTPTSLEAPVFDEGGSMLGDLAEDPRATPDEEAVQNFLKCDIDKVLDTLPERDAEVLRMRFGLKDGVERTLEYVGKYFKVTRERIRQVERNALRRLRAQAMNEGGPLSDYMQAAMMETKMSRSSGVRRK